MTELIYLKDAYKQTQKAKVVSVSVKGTQTEIILDRTVFYPEGGGQPSDTGSIKSTKGTATVKHVRISNRGVVHECTVSGTIAKGNRVECGIDWPRRYRNMRKHTAGHIVHDAVMQFAPHLVPIRGEHGKTAFMEYAGSLTIDAKYRIQALADDIVSRDLPVVTEFVSLEELKRRAAFIPEHLPTNKPLRIMQIADFPAIPDGGTQVKSTSEVGEITIENVENGDDRVRVYYDVANIPIETDEETASDMITVNEFIATMLDIQRTALPAIDEAEEPQDQLKLQFLGSKSEFAEQSRNIRMVPREHRQQAGTVINEVKRSIEAAIARKQGTPVNTETGASDFDPTVPGIRPPEGHLHIVTQAISEITDIFSRIGFTRVRHPEVDWDWYAFEALNMPPDHPARDEWETFFIDYRPTAADSRKSAAASRQSAAGSRKSKMVLTPHTSNGQVREMEKGEFPIRMINIAKCYRRQIDVSHTPMFHQFEGLYIDKNVSITHLKGVIDYFVKAFYGPDRSIRLRPFHFQFTEPSFEIDVSCGICHGKGCRLCKEGWLELGGAGMVHPNVLKAGVVDTKTYNGFAFGWGVERTYMMKSGTKLNDIRLLYSNDIRFLEQF